MRAGVQEGGTGGWEYTKAGQGGGIIGGRGYKGARVQEGDGTGGWGYKRVGVHEGGTGGREYSRRAGVQEDGSTGGRW